MFRSLLQAGALACAVLVAAPAAKAAESLDAAVTAIAQRFIESRAEGSPPIRVAVMPFVQSDRKANQFSNLLMVALTGKMVQLGGAQIRVIERAQLEAALSEIQLSDVPIFDRSTAQKLGSFLSVNMLIVGEVTPLADSVRLDARLLDVETIETVAQAYEWVPLTPTVQRQLDTQVVIARPRVGGDQPDLRNGVWQGVGSCGGLSIGVAVSMIMQPGDKISAMQTYYPSAQGGDGASLQSGTLTMAGTIDPNTNEFKLMPGDWMYRPRGHETMGFSGVIDTGSAVISGRYDRDSCGTTNQITLRRMN